MSDLIFYLDKLPADMQRLAQEDDFQIPRAMTTPPLLTLESFKLATTFSNDGVVHKRAGADDEVWIEVDVIGRGGQGTVYLQQRQPSSPAQLRAVKKLPKELMRSSTDAMRELNTMMAVSDVSQPSRPV